MTGRNNPCPCGSGRKFKRCCLGKGAPPSPQGKREEGSSPRFRFEPGSYGGPGGFVPSIACLKQARPNEWEYHFVIARPEDVHDQEHAAVAEAAKDLERAFESRGSGMGDMAVAQSLRSAGYVSVEGFQVVEA